MPVAAHATSTSMQIVDTDGRALCGMLTYETPLTKRHGARNDRSTKPDIAGILTRQLPVLSTLTSVPSLELNLGNPLESTVKPPAH